MKTRLIGKFPAYPRSDEMDLQIRFESWMRHYPHIKEMYDRNELTIKLDGDDNFTVETVMSDKHWTIWLLKHPNTPAGHCVTIQH